MKQKTLALVFFITIFHFITPLFGQDTYVPGYIITSNADTLTGLINYNIKMRLNNSIGYKVSVESSPVYYNPMDINGFSTNEDKYISAVVDIEKSPRDNKNLLSDPKLNLLKDTVFIQILIEGPKSLFFYNDPNGNENFYFNTASGITLLEYKKYYIIKDYQHLIKEIKRYTGQLTYYLNDRSDLIPDIQKTNYDMYSLLRLFDSYYSNRPGDLAYKRKTEKIKINYGPIAGFTQTSSKFTKIRPELLYDPFTETYYRDRQYDYLLDLEFNKSLNFTGGLFFEFVIPESKDKLSIYNEIMYSSYTVTSFKKSGLSMESKTTTITLGLSYVQMNNLVRYSLIDRGISINIHGGICNGLGFNGKNTKLVVSEDASGTTQTETEMLSELKKLETGPVLGLGLVYKNLFFDARFFRGNGLSGVEVAETATNKIFVLAGYRF